MDLIVRESDVVLVDRVPVPEIRIVSEQAVAPLTWENGAVHRY